MCNEQLRAGLLLSEYGVNWWEAWCSAWQWGEVGVGALRGGRSLGCALQTVNIGLTEFAPEREVMEKNK